jgi:hypothetical protein
VLLSADNNTEGSEVSDPSPTAGARHRANLSPTKSHQGKREPSTTFDRTREDPQAATPESTCADGREGPAAAFEATRSPHVPAGPTRPAQVQREASARVEDPAGEGAIPNTSSCLTPVRDGGPAAVPQQVLIFATATGWEESRKGQDAPGARGSCGAERRSTPHGELAVDGVAAMNS